MDLKNPAMIVAGIDAIAIIGIYIQLQRQISEIADNQERLDEKIKKLYVIVGGPDGKQYETIKEYVAKQKEVHPKNVRIVNKMKEESEKYKESVNEIKEQLDKLVAELGKNNPELKQLEKQPTAKKEERVRPGRRQSKKEPESSESEEDIMK